MESRFNNIFSFSCTGTDDEDQEYDCLGAWGPRFDKLSSMYGQRAIDQIPELDEI